MSRATQSCTEVTSLSSQKRSSRATSEEPIRFQTMARRVDNAGSTSGLIMKAAPATETKNHQIAVVLMAFQIQMLVTLLCVVVFLHSPR